MEEVIKLYILNFIPIFKSLKEFEYDITVTRLENHPFEKYHVIVNRESKSGKFYTDKTINLFVTIHDKHLTYGDEIGNIGQHYKTELESKGITL